jgi:hypothetical protein
MKSGFHSYAHQGDGDPIQISYQDQEIQKNPDPITVGKFRD